MALTNCPDCGFEHSDSAPSCPKCGRPKQRFKNFFEKPIKLLDHQKALLKDWRIKTALATILFTGILLLPRLAKYSLRAWDPFAVTTWKTSVAWYGDGGITYRRSHCRGGFCLFDNSEQVSRDCRRRNEIQFDPKNSNWVTVVNAIPQEKNVKGGTCLGTLYTIKRKYTISGWERLRHAYCESPLVKKSGGKYQDYLRAGNYFWFPPGNLCWGRPMD